MKKLLSVLLVLMLIFTTACAGLTEEEIIDIASDVATDIIEDAFTETDELPTEELPSETADNQTVSDIEDEPADVPPVIEGEFYYDVESVVLYIDSYGVLPDNYITKNEARDLGWEGGSVEPYLEGAAIGGDYFGNREGLLPDEDGREYTECDIDTIGYGSRGARRLVFSNDGLYFYTDDHYESFTELAVEDGEVIWK